MEITIKGAFPSLLVEDDTLYVVTKGKAFAFNVITLKELWKNKMRGMGKVEGINLMVYSIYVC